MGRPVASTQNKVIGICFAKSAIKTTDAKMDLVARSGPYSVYQALTEVYPLCIQAQTNFRDGLTEVQLNKALQKAGFKRVRDRRTHATRRTDDPTGAGMYLFSGVRWRDPNEPTDRQHLLNGWSAMIKKFPMIAKKCSVEHFLNVVAKFHKSWQPNAERTAFAFDVEDESEEDEASEKKTAGFGSLETLLKSFNAQPGAVPALCVGLPGSMPLMQQPVAPMNKEILNLQLQLAVAQNNALNAQKVAAAAAAFPGMFTQVSPSAIQAPGLQNPQVGMAGVDLNSLVQAAYQMPTHEAKTLSSPMGSFVDGTNSGAVMQPVMQQAALPASVAGPILLTGPSMC